MIRELMRQFTKKELLELAEDLEVEVTEAQSSKSIIKILIADLDENGIPAEEDSSQLMDDFLVTAELIDVEDYEEEETVTTTVVTTDSEDGAEARPQCFSFYSDKDPACKRCKISKSCSEIRLQILPECYGKSFDKHSEECKVCIENITCRELVNKE